MPMVFVGEILYTTREDHKDVSGVCELCGRDIYDMYDDGIIINKHTVCTNCYGKLEEVFEKLA